MRAIVLAATAPILLGAAPARAESFLDLLGGVSVPAGDKDWTDQVSSSPMLAVHAGSIPSTVGGMVSADWTPEHYRGNTQFPGVDVSAQRFRLLVGAAFQSPVKAKLMITGRAGIGADIAHASATVNIFGSSSTTSDTDVGLAFEMGAGLWAKVGSVAIGGELAVPIGHHDHKASNTNEITFSYTSVDVDLLFGVRLTSN